MKKSSFIARTSSLLVNKISIILKYYYLLENSMSISRAATVGHLEYYNISKYITYTFKNILYICIYSTKKNGSLFSGL